MMKIIRLRKRQLVVLAGISLLGMLVLVQFRPDATPSPTAHRPPRRPVLRRRVRPHGDTADMANAFSRFKNVHTAKPVPAVDGVVNSKDGVDVVEEANKDNPVDDPPQRGGDAVVEKVAEAKYEDNENSELVIPKGKFKYPTKRFDKFIAGNRIVHLDMKGAAPRLPYFQDVFKLFKKLGATGVLLEWEDMFPYKGRLAIARHKMAYSEGDVKQILSWAHQLDLDIIPLVQTFGHLEWILKHEQFSQFRQQERYPQVICLADDEAVGLVKEAVDQVLALHGAFPIPYFHIGADEAFQIGQCEKDRKLMERELENSRERLMLRHLVAIADHVRRQTAAATSQKGVSSKVLMWHDMLNNVDNELIKSYKLGELLEPVVWNYAENLEDQIYPDLWERFGSAFPYMWAASAFKGADGPSRYYSNVPHYNLNHVSWLSQMTVAYPHFKEFRGIILTGWQRYDHFAVLCEVLPVGLPSAAVNLLTLQRGRYDRSVLRAATEMLGCASTLDTDSASSVPECKFPGADVYAQTQQLRMELATINQEIYSDYQVHGWLSAFNIRHNYSAAFYLDQIYDKMQVHLVEMESIVNGIRKAMKSVFFPDTIDEFLFEYVMPDLKRLREMAAAAKSIGARKTFPVRPFRIRGMLSEWSPRKRESAKGDRKRLNNAGLK